MKLIPGCPEAEGPPTDRAGGGAPTDAASLRRVFLSFLLFLFCFFVLLSLVRPSRLIKANTLLCHLLALSKFVQNMTFHTQRWFYLFCFYAKMKTNFNRIFHIPPPLPSFPRVEIRSPLSSSHTSFTRTPPYSLS